MAIPSTVLASRRLRCGPRSRTRAKYPLKVRSTRSPRVYCGAKRAYQLARYVLRLRMTGSTGFSDSFPARRGLFLDVGANAGMSALSFRVYNRHSQIVSVNRTRATSATYGSLD